MNRMFSIIAGASILIAAASANPALANGHGGGGGGFHGGGGGGFHGGGFHAGGFHSGGFHGGGFRGGGVYGGGFHGGYPGYAYNPYFWGASGLGFGLGLGFYSDAWLYDDPAYFGYYGGYDDPSLPDPSPPPPVSSQAQRPQVCGSWKWDAANSTYEWVPC